MTFSALPLLVRFCLLGALFCLGLFAQHGAATAEVRLRNQVEVHEDVVRLSDVFEGLQAHQDLTIARAPEPGRKLILDANFLSRLTIRYRLGWVPRSRLDRCVVTRASRVVGQSLLEMAVLDALNERGIRGDYRIDFDGSIASIHLPMESEATGDVHVDVRRLEIDQRDARFTATLSVTTPQENREVYTTGRFYKMVQVPVLLERLGRNDVIKARNLDFIEMRSDRVSRNILIDPDDLIGMSPRRGISAGEPITANDIVPAVVVHKGAIVTLRMVSGKLELQALGRAQEDGAMGETIRIMNIDSKRSIYGKVIGPDMVTVSIGGGRSPFQADRNR